MHLITRISVIGITITTAALVILIAAFNGIETMVEKLYSEFDTDLIIRSSTRKTFDEKTLQISALKKDPLITEVSRAVEEIVVLKHEQKWANARLTAVENSFLKMSDMEKHMVDGYPTLDENGKPMGIIGAVLLDKINGFIPQTTGYESLIVYFPKRDAKVSVTSNPFRTQVIQLAGRINYNREVNDQTFILPLDVARENLNYGDDITALYLNVKPGVSVEKAKRKIQEIVGEKFEVKTHFEKNALIYQTSKSERMIVIAILIFVFILAAFNLVASLTMLFIEKKNDIKTLQSFGANDRFIFNIFFYEGLLISGRGVVFGLLLGYGVCALQLFGHVLEMPNSGGEDFPIKITFGDGLLVFALVSTLSVLASYLPVKYLIRKQQHVN